jgi:hypothetical protein
MAVIKMPENQAPSVADASVWNQRRRNNVRLGWVFAGLALALFLLAIWKYRPL